MSAREWSLNSYAVEEFLRERLERKTKSQKGIEMANKPIILQPGNHTAVGTGLLVARVHWAEPPAKGGTATVRDGAGNLIASLTYAGRASGTSEPSQILLNPPVAVQGGSVNCFAPGGHLLVYLSGASGFGG